MDDKASAPGIRQSFNNRMIFGACFGSRTMLIGWYQKFEENQEKRPLGPAFGGYNTDDRRRSIF
jgi:hypothetical protein